MAKTNTHATMVAQMEVNFVAVIANVLPCLDTVTESQIAMTVPMKYRRAGVTSRVCTPVSVAVNVFRGQACVTVTWIVTMVPTNVIVDIFDPIQLYIL